METTVIPKHACPNCGHVMDAASGMYSDRKPQAGDISLCINCATILKFKPDMGVRKMTDNEKRDLFKNNPLMFFNLLRAQTAIFIVNKNYKK